MRIKKLLQRGIIEIIGLTMALMPMTAFASDGVAITDASNATISLIYKDRLNQPISNMRVRLFQIATVTGETVSGAVNGYTVEYHLTDDFKEFDENTGTTRVTGFSEAALNDALVIRPGESDTNRRARWQAIAATIESYAIADVWPTRSLYTDSNGRVDFTGLKPGLYLLSAEGRLVQEENADYRYRYQPTFVALPQYLNGAWDYNRTLNFEESDALLRPKYTYERIEYEYEVFKRWYNDDGSVRPASVQIDIYRDDVFYQTVYLNESNNWTYRWSGGNHTWRIVERTTGSDYSVNVTTGKNTSFTLNNTYNPPETPPGDNPPPPETPPGEVLGTRRLPDPEDLPAVLGMRRLPQTGQLWWPVPLLAGMGMLFFGIGFVRNRRA